jgi:hypothetical protein
MTAARTAGMVAASVIWGAALMLAWPFIRVVWGEARGNLEGCG